MRTGRTPMVIPLLFGILAAAQTPGTGAISGTVFDPAHDALANATITAVENATKVERTAKTGARGEFRIPLLPPGDYAVTFAADGFKPRIATDVPVIASEVHILDATLAISGATANIEVSVNQQIANTEDSTLGGLVDHETIQALPLANRNYTQILGLSPGVIVDLPNAAELGSGTQNVASDGATPTANNIQFNGVDANNLVENSAATAGTSEVGTAIPAIDTIQEFRVQTANFDAAYGRGSGANVDLVSRNGSNAFHGSAWEFVRNNKFNANDFFSKLAAQPRPDLKQNQFGAAFGGPIHRDRLFFFGAYQGLTEVNGFGDEQTAILPMLTSDRSARTLGAQFCPAGHLDAAGQPAAGYLTAAGGTQVACDGSNVNPVALAILNAKLTNGQFAIPTPQVALPPSGPDQVPMGESTFATPARYREDQFTTNLDQIVTQHNTLAARFFYSRAPTTEPFSPNSANVPGWGTTALSRNTMFVLSDTQVLGNALVNLARFGYMRFDGVSHVENPLEASAIGEGTPTGGAGTGDAPGLILGGFSIGDAGTPYQWQVTNTFVWQDTLAWIHGHQSARVGLEIKRDQVDEEQPFSIDGLLIIATFDDFLLGESAAQNGSPFGLSNVTISNAGGGLFRRNERYSDFAGFAQDDIRLNPRLTINAGMRYEIFGAPTETNGRLANFNLSTAPQGPLPADGTLVGFTLPSNFRGSVPNGVVKTPFAGFYRTPLADVSPRLGFAWQLTARPVIVLRGGYGFYYDRHSGNLAEQTMDQLPFARQQFISGAANGSATLQSPFVPLIPAPTSFPSLRLVRPHPRRLLRPPTPTRATASLRNLTSTCSLPRPTPGCSRLPTSAASPVTAPASGNSIRRCSPVPEAPSMARLSIPSPTSLPGCPTRASARVRCTLTRFSPGTTTRSRQAFDAACSMASSSRPATRGRKTWMRSTARSEPMSSNCSCRPTISTTCANPHTDLRATTAIKGSSPISVGKVHTGNWVPRSRNMRCPTGSSLASASSSRASRSASSIATPAPSTGFSAGKCGRNAPAVPHKLTAPSFPAS